jgi:serine/threonine-protein kinase
MEVLGDLPAEVPPGSAVPLRVSSGPAPRTIPAGLAGIAATDAVAQLEALGLVVERTEQFSDDVPEGQSMGTDPGPGTEVPRGSTVVVIVSKGPELVPVPDVRGMDGSDAADELERQGFVVESIVGSPNRPVTSMDPEALAPVRPGASITLSTR